MTAFIDPTKETFAAFRENARPGPVHMLNLIRLHARAVYPDGRFATGRKAYAAYSRDSARRLCAARRPHRLARLLSS